MIAHSERLTPLLSLLERKLKRCPSPPTVWRWHRKGVKVGDRRVRLEAVRVGGKLYSTPEAVEAFIAAQNPPAEPTPADQSEVDKELEQRGLKTGSK